MEIQHVSEFIQQLLSDLQIRDASASPQDTMTALATNMLEVLRECNLDDKEEVYFGVTEAIKTVIKQNKEIKLVKEHASEIGKASDEKTKSPELNSKNSKSPQKDDDSGREVMENQILDSINNFEAVKQKQEEIGEDVSPTENVISTLKETLRELNKQGKLIPEGKAVLSTDSNSVRGLKEIFYFYTRTQMMLGKKPTFDEIINELNTMNLVEFMKFAKDFDIPISPLKLRDLYKRNAHLSREMRVEHFLKFMPVLAKQINDDKIADNKKKTAEQTKKITLLNSEIQKLKTEITSVKQPETAEPKVVQNEAKEEEKKDDAKEESKKEEEPKEDEKPKEESKEAKAEEKPEIHQESNTDPIKAELVKQKEVSLAEMMAVLNTLREELKSLQSLSAEALEDGFYKLIECEDVNKYRKKMKAIGLPFGTKEKNLRIPWDDNSRKYKFKSKMSPEEIKEQVKKIKEKREQQQKLKEQEKESKYKKARQVMEAIHKKITNEKSGSAQTETKKYSEKNRSLIASHEKTVTKSIPNKLTIKEIKKMSYKDFGIDDAVNPLDDIDEEDDIEVLKKFNIITDKDLKSIKKKATEPIESYEMETMYIVIQSK